MSGAEAGVGWLGQGECEDCHLRESECPQGHPICSGLSTGGRGTAGFSSRCAIGSNGPEGGGSGPGWKQGHQVDCSVCRQKVVVISLVVLKLWPLEQMHPRHLGVCIFLAPL